MRAAVALGMVLLCGIAQGAEPKTVTNTIGMELVSIPKGKFTMGSPVGEKDHQDDVEQVAVTLTKSFWLGKTEVTQGQWQQVMGTEPWKGEDCVQIDKDCPVTYVWWDEAVEFCETLTDLERKAGKLKVSEEYRLPTEAEWEYACRAGTTTAFSFGDESKLNSHAWWGGWDLEAAEEAEIKAGPGNAAREQYAHKVGIKKPNPWGLYDMHGNVTEWCSDLYGEKLSGGTDPVGPELDVERQERLALDYPLNDGSERMFRGGNWRSPPGDCRSAHRDGIHPTIRVDYRGFRVARSQSETVAERRQQGAQAEPAPQVAAAERPVQLAANSIGMKLVELPAGEFTMGSPAGEKDRAKYNNEDQVAVTLTKSFWLGKTQVTQGQWKQVMGTAPWKGKDNVQIDKNGAASYLSWEEAKAFCDNLTEFEQDAGKLKVGESYRLPTEAEWEYACRAGTKTAYSFGDDKKQFREYAWFSGNTAGEQYAHAVGMKKPNPWGLHDMHGNVWEWCSDWYDEKLSGGTDPVGPRRGSRRVARGGSWMSDPGNCRSAIRLDLDPSSRNGPLGFRVARSQSAQ